MARLPVYTVGQCKTVYSCISIDYSSIVHLIGLYRKLLYFPMQKVAKS